MNEGVALLVDVDRARLERRRELRYLDKVVDSREDALREVERARKAGEAISIGYEGNAATEFWALYNAGFRPDAVTNKNLGARSHQRLRARKGSRYEAMALRTNAPDEDERRALESCGEHLEAMVKFLDAGRSSSTTGTTTAQARAGYVRAFDFLGFVPRSFARSSQGSVRSGLSRSRAIRPTSIVSIASCWHFPNDAGSERWITLRKSGSPFRGCRRHLLAGYGDRAKPACASTNSCVRRGQSPDRHWSR